MAKLTQRIAHHFSRAALTYDAHAHVQRRVAQQLLTYAHDLPMMPQHVLELGTGTGYCGVYLQRLFPKSSLILQDISLAMLHVTRRRLPYVPIICSDFEQLPIPDASVDLIYTNMSLQWGVDLANTLLQLQRILRPNGVLLFSLPIVGTFVELLDCLQHMERQGNVWMAYSELTQVLQAQQWRVLACDREYLTLFYPTVRDFIQELKSLGANGLRQAEKQFMMSRRDWHVLENKYEKYRNSQRGLPVSYHIVYGVIQK